MMAALAKETYVYGADALDAYTIASGDEQLLPGRFVCNTGWVAFLNPPYLNSYLCQAGLPAALGQSGMNSSASLDASLVVRIDRPWIVQGDCYDNVVHLCEAPSESVHWGCAPENVIATYYLCTDAVLVGMRTEMMRQWPVLGQGVLAVSTNTSCTTTVIEAECTAAPACNIEDILLLALVAIGAFIILYGGSLGLFIFAFLRYHHRVVGEIKAKYADGDGTPMSHFEEHMT